MRSARGGGVCARYLWVVSAILIGTCTTGCGGSVAIPPQPIVQPADSAPAWSPDARLIAYVHFNPVLSDTSEPSGLYVVDTTGAHRRLLVPGFPGTVDWSPDGQRLVYNDDCGLHVLTLADGIVNDIYGGGSFPKWSPVGSTIAFDTNRRIWLISPTGENMRQAADAFPVRMPDWSADGTRLVVVEYPQTAPAGELAIIRLADGALHEITHDSRVDEYPSWSPDNARIAWNHWSQSRYGNNLPEIWVADTSGVAARKVVSSDGTFGWHPNGRSIVFSMQASGAIRLFAVGADGSGLRQITH